MDIFKVSKVQSKYENPVYVAKILYDLLKTPKLVDQLFNAFEKKTGEVISYEYEQTLYLTLCFMYSTGMIITNDLKIMRCNWCNL